MAMAMAMARGLWLGLRIDACLTIQLPALPLRLLPREASVRATAASLGSLHLVDDIANVGVDCAALDRLVLLPLLAPPCMPEGACVRVCALAKTCVWAWA